MTIPVFPSLKGITYPRPRASLWKTARHEATSGKTTAISLQSFPRYRFTVEHSFLRSDSTNQEWQSLQNFFNSIAGGALPFHYQDPNDFSITGGSLGATDGVTSLYPFIRTLPSAVATFVEPIQDVNPSAVNPNGVNVYLGGVIQAPASYTLATTTPLGTTYAIQFNSAPAAGQAITADFQYWWLCRFDDDTADFENFMSQLFRLKALKFTSVKQ
jgi:uncharacterized protein (TIGR02217 family)